MCLISRSKLLIFMLIVLHIATLSCSMGVDEDSELDRKLKILNKKPVKTFEEKEGDIIDCIHIHKQHAFDHPLLKDHKIQKHSKHPKGSSYEASSTSTSSTTHSWVEVKLKQYDCPKGTVPIRRTSKEDLIRAKSLLEVFNKNDINSASFATNTINSDPPSTYEPSVQRVAMLHSANSSTLRYYGVRLNLRVDKPSAERGQFTSSQVWLEAGPAWDVTSIQAGWAVAPSLFGDDNPRTFIFWKSNGGKHGCFNLLCPGFVQTGSVSLGQLMHPISVYGASRFAYVQINIYQDYIRGSWYLNIGGNVVGYWPKEMIDYVATRGASYVAWGGLTRRHPNSPSPEMGNGFFPNENKDMTRVCSIFDVNYFSDVSQWTPINADDNNKGFVTRVDNPNCYNFKSIGFKDHFFQYAYMFGGPGGANC